MRLPRSLFGRNILVLAACLMLSQLATQLVNVFDRGSSLYELNSSQVSSRIARTTRLLNHMDRENRLLAIRELGGRDFRIEISGSPIEIEGGFTELNNYERSFAAAIRDELDPPLLTSVEITRSARPRSPEEVEAPSANSLEQWVARRFYFMLPGTFSLVAQVELQDGSTAVFYVRMPQEPLSQLEALLPTLLMWIAIVFVLSLLAVRMMTQPLRVLDGAVSSIADNPTGSSAHAQQIPETGPVEVRSLIRRFNEAQERIRRYMIERSSLLAAISHDLRTPITRMRLRAEMLPEAQRVKFIHDLKEMEELVGSSLDLFKELGKGHERRPVDLVNLMESIADDWTDTGKNVGFAGAVESGRALAQREAGAGGAVRVVFPTEASMLRRCINNLTANAIRYGGDQARLELEDTGDQVLIRICDSGPGMPEHELERVFEPFVRLEPSRNRSSGGTGIGLAISRNIARWHGGDIALRNAPAGPDGKPGGLIAEIRLPRDQATAPRPRRRLLPGREPAVTRAGAARADDRSSP